MKLHFKISYFTEWGTRMLVTGNIPELGNNDYSKAVLLTHEGHEDWYAEVDFKPMANRKIVYKYILFNERDNKYTEEWGDNRNLNIIQDFDDIYCFDTWNNAGSIENAFMTAPFKKVLFKENANTQIPEISEKTTHIFKVKAPLLSADQVLCVIGNTPEIGKWSVSEPLLMVKDGDYWTAGVDLSNATNDINYKYGVFNTEKKQFLYFEQGPDRIAPVIDKKKCLIQVENGFVRLDNRWWRGAGVSLPVFSIRTRNSFGVGDFVDMRLLIDWAEKVGLKLFQVLPLNDTNGTHTENDVLPYAAITAFALNPLYLNLPEMGTLPKNNELQIQYIPKQAELNAKDLIPFLDVINFKMRYAKEMYLYKKDEFFKDSEFHTFFDKNAFWLVPYAAYCVLKEKFGTNNYRQWEEYATFDTAKINEFVSENQPHYDEVALHYFIQFHLHTQLSETAKYAHARGVVLKGDIPIGVNKNSVDTWVNPELFHMNMSAGAPPDMFAVKGQNWDLPTYNWEVMAQTGFAWWKKRFEQLSNYFDTFRIDHILGFFRIWEIPTNQMEGIMGHLNPSIPIHINEFGEKGVWFNYDRFCKPYITDHILWLHFGEEAAWVKANCLQIEDGWVLRLKPEFQSQTYVEKLLEEGKISERVKWGLFDLISNVLFFEKEGSNGTQFYPRYGFHYLTTYADLDDFTKNKLDELYINYFYHRQDSNFYHSGMEKLPALKRATNMLVCGEDLGMMNPAVTAVMNELGILSLEVQRAPKSSKIDFFHPADAPYLSVVTPSTHDMSTIRGWWEEDRDVSQKFYNSQLGHWGQAPYFCEWWIVRDILLQHLYSPAMWSIFQMQDLLGISEKLRRKNPQEERINDPSNSKASWRYRVHIKMEDLLLEEEFNNELRNFITQAGR